MNYNYINIYNNLINLTRNKDLYKGLVKQDIFSDRLIFFLLHFAFFLKNYKVNTNKKIMQEIFDYCFKQLELSIREIGYGDQSINKKMKDYINVFHGIISELHYWNELEFIKKKEKLSIFLHNFDDIEYLVDYFNDFTDLLSKNNLNSYIKSVSNP